MNETRCSLDGDRTKLYRRMDFQLKGPGETLFKNDKETAQEMLTKINLTNSSLCMYCVCVDV